MGVPLYIAPGNVSVHAKSCTAHCPQVVWQCIVGVPLPMARSQCGGKLQEFHGPLPHGVAVHYRGSTAHCP